MEFLDRIEDMARKHGLPIIGPEKGRVLIETVTKHDPKHVLEIGTNIGYSAVLMSQHFGGRITTVEIDPLIASIARQNIRHAGLSGRIRVVVGPALAVIARLRGPFDMLFLDALKEEYHGYLKAAEPKLSDGAVIVADNVGVFEDQMQEFLDYVRHSGKYFSRTVDFGFDAVEVSESIGMGAA